MIVKDEPIDWVQDLLMTQDKEEQSQLKESYI